MAEVEELERRQLPAVVRVIRQSMKGNLMGEPALWISNQGKRIAIVNLGVEPIDEGQLVLAAVRVDKNGYVFGDVIRKVDTKEEAVFMKLASAAYELVRPTPPADLQGLLEDARQALLTADMKVAGELGTKIARTLVERSVEWFEAKRAGVREELTRVDARESAIDEKERSFKLGKLAWEAEVRPMLGWVATLKTPLVK